MAAAGSVDRPFSVATVANRIKELVEDLPAVWIEGQITQLSLRPGAWLGYLSLRDVAADASISVSFPQQLLHTLGAPLEQGQRVYVLASPEFWVKRGSLQFKAREIRTVGLGDFLAQLEALKQKLAAEGLFDPERKKPIPFLPRRVGLICGRASDAERDVVENAKRRWPQVQFEIREVAVQGSQAVSQVSQALSELESHPDVDVIVLTRGGGSVEDLMPFSHETLLRLVASCHTPIISAIGHEKDTPLLDFVADWRASTPTDAGKKVVPDMAAELAGIATARSRNDAALTQLIARLRQQLTALSSRPAFAQPHLYLAQQREDLAQLQRRAHHSCQHLVRSEQQHLEHTIARIRSLSPQATLQRGYAVVRNDAGEIIRTAAQAPPGTFVRIRLATEELTATTTTGKEHS